MNRRGFLKGLLGFGAVSAAGLVLPDVEPVRRFWQVGANAPVAAREPAFERYLARKFGLRLQLDEDLAEIERSLRAPVNPAVLRFEQSVLRAAKNGDAEALAYAPVIGAVREGKDASGLYAGPPIFPKRDQPDEYGPESDWRAHALALGDDDDPDFAREDDSLVYVPTPRFSLRVTA